MDGEHLTRGLERIAEYIVTMPLYVLLFCIGGLFFILDYLLGGGSPPASDFPVQRFVHAIMFLSAEIYRPDICCRLKFLPAMPFEDSCKSRENANLVQMQAGRYR